MHHTYFYPRDGVLQMRITIEAGVYRRVSTGIKIPKQPLFSKAQQRFIGKGIEAQELNKMLQEQRVLFYQSLNKGDTLSKFKEVRKDFELRKNFTDCPTDLQTLGAKYLELISSGKILTKKRTVFKSASIYFYRHALRTLAEYGQPMDLMDYNLSSNMPLEQKRLLSYKWNGFYEGLIHMMKANGLAQNTIHGVLVSLQIIVNHWARELYIQLPKMDVGNSYAPPIVVLPDTFVREFINDKHKMYEKFTPRYKYLWELFATIMVTTLRIGDAMRLNARDVQFEGSKAYLRKFNKKTGAETFIPLPPSLSNIYGKNLQEYGNIYTTLGIFQIDVYRQSEDFFAQYEELRHPVSITRLMQDGKEEVITKPLYAWAKPHMLRKTAITAMLANGVKEEHVKFASGHSDRSASFERYKGFVERKFKSEINNYYDNFLNISTNEN